MRIFISTIGMIILALMSQLAYSKTIRQADNVCLATPLILPETGEIIPVFEKKQTQQTSIFVSENIDGVIYFSGASLNKLSIGQLLQSSLSAIEGQRPTASFVLNLTHKSSAVCRYIHGTVISN
jgi:hypothetical protein